MLPIECESTENLQIYLQNDVDNDKIAIFAVVFITNNNRIMKYVFVFVNFSVEEGRESLDIPKVYQHKKDAMKEFEKRKKQFQESYKGFEGEIMAEYENPGYYSFSDYDGNYHTIYVKKVKVIE